MKIIRIIIILLVISLASYQIYTIEIRPKNEQEIYIIQETQALIPMSIRMIDNAIEVLEGGLAEMSPDERKLFNEIFDPGDTGTINQSYIEEVVKNYSRIRQRLEQGIEFEYTADSSSCRGMRLYYTNIFKVFVCPYFLEEDNLDRKTLTLIHEAAHMKLLVLDRYYYDPKSYSSRYHALSPRGSIYTKIPVIGHFIREIQRSDTLYHPDTYAWFAGLVKSNTAYSGPN